MAEASNPLVSQRSSDSGLQVYLHPLVLLNISDHITRHAARQQHGPIVGALLGQLQGRTISLEHVFECNLITAPNGDLLLDNTWFAERLQQFKDVHKSPALDLVGWFTITPPSGPTPAQLPVHRQILQEYNETALLLAFHASDLENISPTVGKLPITVYESIYEGDNADDGEKSMEIDGEERALTLKFRELPYSIETGEAEMISVDFVASGGGNATAIDTKAAGETKPKDKKAGKDKEKAEKEEAAPEISTLSREDEDLIANLTTRLSAVKTLESRLNLIKAYLESIKQSNAQPTPSPSEQSSSPSTPPLSHALLRSIYSLISHLALLNPQQSETLSLESLAQANDVALTAILGSMGQSVQQMRELGKKFAFASTIRQSLESRDTRGMAHPAMEARMRDEGYLQSRGMGGMGGGLWHG